MKSRQREPPKGFVSRSNCLATIAGISGSAVAEDAIADTLAGVKALGSEMIGKLIYYERRIVTFADILYREDTLAPTERPRRMDEIEFRWALDHAFESAEDTRP